MTAAPHLWPDEPGCGADVEGEPCAMCGDPVPDLRYGLCAECRCAGCGEPAAPIEWRESRWCAHCAAESGYVAPLYLEAAE